MMKEKIAIIKTGATDFPLQQQLGDFEDWIIRHSGKNASDFTVLPVNRIGTWPSPGEFEAIIITGSHTNITDNPDWLPELIRYVRRAYNNSVLTLGICFGHQLLAYAFGGQVADNAKGPEFGAVSLRLTSQGQKDPLFANVESNFTAFMSHQQSVTVLPQKATVLARSFLDPHAAFYLEPSVWGVQFHPEFDSEIMSWYLTKHYHILGTDVQQYLSLASPSVPIIRNFLALAQAH